MARSFPSRPEPWKGLVAGVIGGLAATTAQIPRPLGPKTRRKQPATSHTMVDREQGMIAEKRELFLKGGAIEDYK